MTATGVAFLTGCGAPPDRRETRPPSPTVRTVAPTTTRAALTPTSATVTQPDPVAAPFAPAPRATPSHVHELEPAILDLAARAEAGDTAYFAARMGHAGAHQVQLMIDRVRGSDMSTTYRSHLIGDRPNYHDSTHVQVELALRDGSWVVSSLWFCR